MGFWTDKRVLISGGSKGIGRATALLAAERGAKVVVLARGQDALDATLAELNAISNGHGAVSTDIADFEAVNSAVAEAVTVLGGIDVVISNAGVAQMSPMHEASESQYRKMMDVNYFGAVWLSKAASPHLWESKGHICYVTSAFGYLSTWGSSAYTASKFATRGLAEAMRQEFMLHGVTTTNFFPNTTDTPGLKTENETKHPVAWAIEGENVFNKVYTPDECGFAILKTVERGAFYGAGLFMPWLFWTAMRLSPRLVHLVLDMDLRNAIKKLRVGPDGRPLDSSPTNSGEPQSQA